MVIKVYISGISGNKEVKKRQQRVLLILDSKNVKYEVIDIAEPGAEEAKDFVQNNSTSPGATISDPTPRHPLPPQIFNEDEYCGDYDMFDMANEVDEMEKFLKLKPNSLNEQKSTAEIKLKNGDATVEEKIEKLAGDKHDEESKENAVPFDQKVEEKETKNEIDVPAESAEKIESDIKEEHQEKEALIDREVPAESAEKIESDIKEEHQEKEAVIDREGSVEKEKPKDEEIPIQEKINNANDDDVKQTEEKEASPEKSDE